MYYNIDTKQLTKTLPERIEVGGTVISNPSLKECSLIGWREMPETPKAEAGSVIVDVAYVQDDKDALKVKAIVTTKTDAQVADEKAAQEQAQADAQAQYAADRKAKRDEITAPFDKEQAEAIGKLFDAVRFP